MAYVKSYKNLKSINSDFIILSKFFEKKLGKFWWFLDSSRLDLAPWGLSQNKSSFITKIIIIVKNIFKIIYYFFLKIITKHELNIKYKKPS